MAATTSPVPVDEIKTSDKPDRSAPVVLDLGKQRRKRIKQLRKGEGRLLDDINGAIEELRTVGTIGALSQPVVIVVREKARKTKSLFGLL